MFLNLARLIRNSSSIMKNINARGLADKATDTVIVEEIKNAGVITLNKPKALNAINLEMVRVIYNALKKMENTKSLVIIKGAGGKAFCAGGDVRSVVELDPSYGRSFFYEEYTVNNLIGNYKIPYVALIDGITMGGGVGLSVHGKYRVATEKTLFAMPETAIGLFPDVGGSHLLSRMNGKLGLYLALTGARLKGKDVLKSGVATHFCDSAKIPELQNALLTCKASNEVELVIRKFCAEDNTEFSLDQYSKQINDCFSAASVEEIIAKLKNDGSKWAQNTIEVLEKMCPTSLKITHRQIENGASLNLSQCLQMEYRMAYRSAIEHDFAEGVRALLISKTNKPIWNPLKLSDVTEERIQSFFANLPENEELKFDGNLGSNIKSSL